MGLRHISAIIVLVIFHFFLVTTEDFVISEKENVSFVRFAQQ